jgi:hypothetical protein
VELPPAPSLKTTLLLKWAKPLIPFLVTPAVYQPELDASGLVNLPASCWIGPNHRLEKSITFINLHQLRHNQVVKAIERAAREKKVIHVWAHPYEYREEKDLAKLRQLLDVVGRYIADGSLRSIGMSELAQQSISTPIQPLQMERVN